MKSLANHFKNFGKDFCWVSVCVSGVTRLRYSTFANSKPTCVMSQKDIFYTWGFSKSNVKSNESCKSGILATSYKYGSQDATEKMSSSYAMLKKDFSLDFGRHGIGFNLLHYSISAQHKHSMIKNWWHQLQKFSS